MKTKRTLYLLISLLFTVYFYACDASGYEISEVPDDSPHYDATSIDSNSPLSQQKSAEIPTPAKGNFVSKESANIDAKIVQSSSGSKLPEKVFTIQIGAFTNEVSAQSLSENAAGTIGSTVNLEKIGGLYKVRCGAYNSLSDAIAALDKVKSSGFKDCFITEKGK